MEKILKTFFEVFKSYLDPLTSEIFFKSTDFCKSTRYDSDSNFLKDIFQNILTA